MQIYGDTIYALASGGGRAALAVVRVSGPLCRDVVEALCGRLPIPRRASLLDLRGARSRDLLDRALVLWFPGPASFTGEDCVEFQLHGSRAVLAAVFKALGELGCRAAEAGEFSRRAFLNGKMDLTEIEGLGDLIAAETEAQRRQALRQLSGVLGTQTEAWRRSLLQASALIESQIDFADEDDVTEVPLAEVQALLRPVRDAIAELLDRDGRRGERLRDGFSVVIAGPPNAGKSTLLNALAERDVAIVSPYAGTTRDALEVHLDLEGLPIILVDTAGIRESDDPIEREGIARARQRAAQADLVLWLEAAHLPPAPPAGFAAPVLRVTSQMDRARPNTVVADHAISVATGEGIAPLLGRIAACGKESLMGAESSLVTRARHRDALSEAKQALDRACASSPRILPELLAEDIRLAARGLGRIAGVIDVEDVLGEIFSRFCIGK
jgi:tRNA modification GTPase